MEKRPDRGGRERLAPKDQQEKEGFHDILPFIPPRLFCPGEHLRICPQEYTCCSSEIEQRLTWETESIFRSLVEESGSFLVHTLDVRHRKFDGEDLGSQTWPLLSVLMTPGSILSPFPVPSLRRPSPGLAPTPSQALSRVLCPPPPPPTSSSLPRALRVAQFLTHLSFLSPSLSLSAFVLSLPILLWPNPHLPHTTTPQPSLSLDLPQRFFEKCSRLLSTP